MGVLEGYAIAAAVMSLVAVVVGRAVRRQWLDACPLLPGERVLLEAPVRVVFAIHGAAGQARFPRAHARVTDRRVLVGQRPLFGKQRGRYALLAVIDLGHHTEEPRVLLREWAVMRSRRSDAVEEGEWVRLPVVTEAGAWRAATAVLLTAGQGQPSLVRAIVRATGPILPPV